MPQGPYLPEGFRLHTPENRWVNTPAAMDQAAEEEQILEGIVTRCDCAHNLVVDCNGITGLIPRSEAALGLSSGRTREIALLSRVGKPVCFQVIGEGDGQYLFSRARVQQKALNYLMENLLPGDDLRPGDPSGALRGLCGHRLRPYLPGGHRAHLGVPHCPSCRAVLPRPMDPCGCAGSGPP